MSDRFSWDQKSPHLELKISKRQKIEKNKYFHIKAQSQKVKAKPTLET